MFCLGAFSVIVKTDGSFAALASTLNLAPTPTFTQTLHHHRKILILMINDAIIDRLEINRRTECRPCLISEYYWFGARHDKCP